MFNFVASLANKAKYAPTPYIVMVGDPGTGKSTVVEKLTGQTGRSSDSSRSCTKTAEPFWTYDGTMVISDTPGCNAIDDNMEQSQWIAGAINFMPLSKIFIIVKAEVRQDTTIKTLEYYSDKLIQLPDELIGVMVTHMDQVMYDDESIKKVINRKFGIEGVVCTQIDDPRDKLVAKLKKSCEGNKPQKLTIDSALFLKLFDLRESDRKPLKLIAKDVDLFNSVKEYFDKIRDNYTGKNLVDLLFEFQAWMIEQVEVMQKNFCTELDFDFMGVDADLQAGYCALLTNQLRTVIYGIRIETEKFAVSGHGVVDARQCPHCKEVWMKVAGCEGATTCGNRLAGSLALDIRAGEYAELGTYSFRWINNALNIQLTGMRSLNKVISGNSYGCGKSIDWSQMRPVDTKVLCLDKNKGPSKLDEIDPLPKDVKGSRYYKEKLTGDIKDKTRKMHLGEKPDNH